MKLNGKIAVVTGASRGLGKAIARALVRENVRVYGLARTDTALKEIHQELGESFVAVSMNITNMEQVRKWIHKTFSDAHSPDILINNAGTGSFHAIDETSFKTWKSMMDVNLNGLFNIATGLVPYLKNKAYSTHIINIGSILGTVGRKNSTAYSATKFGIRGFSESLFLELRDDRVKVTCVNPGSIETDFFSDSGIRSHDHMLQPDDLAETIIHLLQTPDNYLVNEMTIRPLIPKPNGRGRG